MDANLKEFYKKFQVTENLIHKTDHWSLSLRPKQATLGSCVISLNRYCERLSDITDEESADFKNIVKLCEDTLKEKLRYEKINYLMLMMVDSHLHYHVIPRFSEAKEFEGQSYSDENWPKPPALGGPEIARADADKLIKFLKGE